MKVPLPVRLLGYVLVVFAVAAAVVVHGGLPIVVLAALVTLIGLPATVILEVRSILRRPNSPSRIGRELGLVTVLIGTILALPPFMRGVRSAVETRALAEAERRIDRTKPIAAFLVSESGFAGRSFFSVIVFDRSGEIERAPEKRSDGWWAEARRADGVLAACSQEASVRKLKPDFYWADIAC